MTFASDGPVGGWLVLQDGDEVRVGPHRLIFEVVMPDDGVAEALAALEQATEQRPARRKRKRVVPRAVTQAKSEDEQKPEELIEATPAEAEDPDAEGE